MASRIAVSAVEFARFLFGAAVFGTGVFGMGVFGMGAAFRSSPAPGR
jgi:hypothetical protein